MESQHAANAIAVAVMGRTVTEKCIRDVHVLLYNSQVRARVRRRLSGRMTHGRDGGRGE